MATFDQSMTNESADEMVSTHMTVSAPKIGKWDETCQTWLYTDPQTGIQFEWDPTLLSYLPKVEAQDLERQQAAYIHNDPPKTPNIISPLSTTITNPHLTTPSLIALASENRYQKDNGAIVITEDEQGIKYVSKKVNRSIYVTNLPLDLQDKEYIDFFSKVGLLKKDVETGKIKIKLYRGEDSKLKGDGVVTYLRPESVQQALLILDGTEIRQGYVVKIEPARYKIEGEEPLNPSRKKRGRKRLKSSATSMGHDQKEGDGGLMAATSTEKKVENRQVVAIPQRKKKRIYNQQMELSWDEEHEPKHVILKKMFRVEDAVGNLYFYKELQKEVRTEVEKLGKVDHIKVFEGNHDGVVAIKFQTSEAASKCIALMNGRWFDGISITAEYYDGISDYSSRETLTEEKMRDHGWEEWLMSKNDQETNSSTSTIEKKNSASTPTSPKEHTEVQ